MASQNTSGFNPVVTKWTRELEYALKREKDFRKEGRRIVQIYEAEKAEEVEFNILYSNTETLQPALYNNIPRPVVERRYKDKDPMGKIISLVTKRELEYLIDSNDQDYSNFDDMMKQAVLEALLPGRGITRFKYHPTYGDVIPPEPLAEGAEPPKEDEVEELREVTAETVCGEEVPWDRFRCGYAKKWKDVPWIAFEHFMDQAEAGENFGTAIAARIPYTACTGKEENDNDDDGERKIADADGEKLAHIFEIWDKRSKKVTFIAAGFGEVLKEVADTLNLSGFFPCPRPLGFMSKISNMTPVALYKMYEKQAKELNTCTVRIGRIMAALKVRGFYDSTLGGLKELFEAEENSLHPAENVSAMLQGQTLERAIWFFPVEKLVGVLQQLYVQREQCKAVIYEITGISDILRGSSVASETATAQNIKNQWGTLRLKKMQKEVMRYVRDSLRIMAEIAATKLSPETAAAMTGLDFPTAEQKAQAQQAIATAQAQAQQTMAIQAQEAAMTGQPPPQPQPPQIPPELQEVAAKPSWEEISALMRDDLQRNYKIDIETNSTVDAEATEDKADVAEFMNAMAQFMNGMMPLVEQGVMDFGIMKTMLLSIVRRFRFGVEVEDQIESMQPPPPKQPGDDPKAQAEKAKADAEMAGLQAQAAADKQKLENEAALNAQTMQAKQAQMAMEAQLAQMKMDAQKAQMLAEAEYAALEHRIRMEELAMKQEELVLKKALMEQQKAEMAKSKGEKENA